MSVIRLFDIIFSVLGLIVLSPLIVIIVLIIKLTSKGPVLFKQVRVGRHGKDFKVYKFRTMDADSDKKGLLTVGGKDNRITTAGVYLRKYKMDEIPQLLNVLKGDMSIVGPRPEVRKYVEKYSSEQREVLKVLPGITDYASIAYRNENDMLAAAGDPENFYIRELIPKKIELNFKYIHNQNLKNYFNIIGKTIITSIKGR